MLKNSREPDKLDKLNGNSDHKEEGKAMEPEIGEKMMMTMMIMIVMMITMTMEITPLRPHSK